MAETPSVEEMLATRVARRTELKAFPESFIDTVIPRYQRDLFSIIGKSVFEDPAMKPAIKVVHPFSVAIIKVEPGKGAGLHAHDTEEIFMPLNGKLAVFWGEKGEEELVLGPMDLVTLPIHVMRGFRNVDDKTIEVLAINGGDDGGRLAWNEDLIEEAKQHGGQLDDAGYIRPKEEA
ncbi:MAG: cupin domain-containing protein [Pseudomonadota bacterium]